MSRFSMVHCVDMCNNNAYICITHMQCYVFLSGGGEPQVYNRLVQLLSRLVFWRPTAQSRCVGWSGSHCRHWWDTGGKKEAWECPGSPRARSVVLWWCGLEHRRVLPHTCSGPFCGNAAASHSGQRGSRYAIVERRVGRISEPQLEWIYPWDSQSFTAVCESRHWGFTRTTSSISDRPANHSWDDAMA